MNSDELRRQLETDESTALARLGSTAFLRAIAAGEPAPPTLLDAAAASEHAALVTFREWADSESDPLAHSAFASVAEQEATHRERVAAELDGWTPDDDGAGPMHAYLRGREATTARIAGGMVGRPLVTLRTHERLVSFFGDERGDGNERGGDNEREDGGDRSREGETIDDNASRRAALFSELRAETADVLRDGIDLLENRCETDDEWETAKSVAAYTIRLAGDDAADALRAQGIDPDAADT
ncbi:rubrerythrin family protein [Halobellus sp. GM3]|uniref:rubrerythrin family protein n=1 Tax=Halobellus sp. GM3 TaxID=3458410 RepID=UPI00403E204D